MDSMAVYRGMDIGTAKPTTAERQAVPHHLLDMIEPSQEFSLAQYVEAAHVAVGEIRTRGREVLFVGGTPLYLKALVRGIFEGPPADWDLRNGLMDRARTEGAAALHQELRRVDPRSAERIHLNDLKRVVRALEVHEKTGITISELQREYPAPSPRRACEVVVVHRKREALKPRICERVDRMARAGLVQEVRALLDRRRGLGFTARQALGYKEILDYFDGKCSLTEALQSVKQGTWRLARRQFTWLRSLQRARWVEVRDGELPEQVAGRVLQTVGSGERKGAPL